MGLTLLYVASGCPVLLIAMSMTSSPTGVVFGVAVMLVAQLLGIGAMSGLASSVLAGQSRSQVRHVPVISVVVWSWLSQLVLLATIAVAISYIDPFLAGAIGGAIVGPVGYLTLVAWVLRNRP
ncbi:MAG: hypothetical protein AAF138_05780 [Planctomycetota bacterium]